LEFFYGARLHEEVTVVSFSCEWLNYTPFLTINELFPIFCYNSTYWGRIKVEAKDIIQLLRLQRHDLMNDLQIVHGYLSMGKTDKVKLKVNNIIGSLNQERMLMNINCPKFALWLIQLKLQHKHIQFTYDILTENNNLISYDGFLEEIGHTVENYILANKFDTITGAIQLKYNNNSIDLAITITSPTIDCDAWEKHLADKLNNVLIQAEELESEVKFTFSIPSTE
jgi:stage 0 sporulation protein B (sporulation initiation phosphotransferase)